MRYNYYCRQVSQLNTHSQLDKNLQASVKLHYTCKIYIAVNNLGGPLFTLHIAIAYTVYICSSNYIVYNYLGQALASPTM